MPTIIDGTAGITFPNSTVQASAGQVLQVVNANYTTLASTTSSTYTATGLTATITPRFSTSKILVLVSQNGFVNATSGNGIGFRLLRNSTVLTVIELLQSYFVGSLTSLISTGSVCYLDSPATTSATTYSTQFNSFNNTNLVSVQNNSDNSTITLMEIAA
jgi:hypothetical protein